MRTSFQRAEGFEALNLSSVIFRKLRCHLLGSCIFILGIWCMCFALCNSKQEIPPHPCRVNWTHRTYRFAEEWHVVLQRNGEKLAVSTARAVERNKITCLVPKASLQSTANFVRIISIPFLEILIQDSTVKPWTLLIKSISGGSDAQLIQERLV